MKHLLSFVLIFTFLFSSAITETAIENDLAFEPSNTNSTREDSNSISGNELLLTERAISSTAMEMEAIKLSRMTIYDQGDYTSSASSKWVLAANKDEDRDLKDAGCMLFSFAHAIQWVTGQKTGDELIIELVNACKDPNGNRSHNGCSHSKSNERSDGIPHYFAQCSNRVANRSIPKEDLESLRKCFSSGAVIGISGCGHIALAVEEKTINGVSYTHIIDSNWGTFQRKGKLAYYLIDSTNSVTEIKYKGYPKYSSSNYDGSNYWIKTDDLFSTFAFSYACKKASGYSDTTQSIGEFSLVAEIQAVVYTRDDKGITEYKLQKEPYAAAETVTTVAPCTYLTTTGVYKNKHGNYWLKLTNNTYLCANDVELVFQVDPPEGIGLVYPTGNLTLGKSFDLKGTITSQSTMPEVWAVVSKPDDESFTPVTAKLTNVTSVDIYTSALNKSSLGGISFSKLPKGDYCFTLWAYYYEYKNVEKTSSVPLSVKQVYFLEGKPFTVGGGGSGTSEEVNDAVDLCTLNAKFTYNKDANTHKLPYAASTKMGSVKAGQTVTVTKLVQNRYNNIWAQLSDGSYVCFYDKTTGEHHMTFQSTNALEVSDDVKKPTGDIPLATSFGLRGTITADMPIYSVTAKVTNRATEDVAVGPVTATSAKGAFTKSVTMNKALNGVNINDKMSFKKLTAAGYYRYEVVVQLGFIYAFDGEVFQFGTEQVAISSDFTAGNPEDEELLPDVPDEPTLTRLPGDANDDAVVDIYDALLILQYDAGWNVSLNTSNADVNADNSVDIYDALLILQYGAGWNVVLK